MIKKVGIICASDTELDPFIKIISSPIKSEKAMLTFYEGFILGKSVVCVYSGVGKVNAAIATQQLIDIYHVEIIINAGVAGAIDNEVQILDTVIPTKIAYHDIADDILTEFHPWLDNNYFHSDEKLLSIAKQYSIDSQYPILFGKIVTGEEFIEGEKRNEIKQKFSPLAVDMETASVAHVCYVNHIPFLATRTISDTVSHQDFEKNCEIASQRATEVTINLLQIL